MKWNRQSGRGICQGSPSFPPNANRPATRADLPALPAGLCLLGRSRLHGLPESC